MIAEHKNNGLSLYPVLTFLIGSENGGLFYSYRLMSLMDIAWTEVMHKDGQTFCLGLVISLLHIFCVVMQLPESYENKRFVYM